MGHELPDLPLVGLLSVALSSLTLVAIFGAFLYYHEVAVLIRRLLEGVRQRPELELPVHPPIEQVAHNARRLRAELLTLTPGTPMARRRGLAQAYDDVLVIACRALDVPDTLTGLEPGLPRDAERAHLEHELEAAGMRLSV
jgi:hypothetical protein